MEINEQNQIESLYVIQQAFLRKTIKCCEC